MLRNYRCLLFGMNNISNNIGYVVYIWRQHSYLSGGILGVFWAFFSSLYVIVCCVLWCISRSLSLAAFSSGVTSIKKFALIPDSNVKNVATI